MNKACFDICDCDYSLKGDRFECLNLHINVLYKWLVMKGYNSDALLRKTPEIVRASKDKYQISFEDVRKFVLNAMDVAQNEALGLEFGEFCGLYSYGLLGYAMMFSKNVKESIKCFCDNYTRMYSIFRVRVRYDDRYCYMILEKNADFYSSEKFFSFLVVGYVITVLSSALDGKNVAEKICLTMEEPRGWKQGGRFQNCRIEFESDFNCITFPVHCLKLHSVYRDAVSMNMLQQLFEYKLCGYKKPDHLIIDIKNILGGYSSGFPSQEEVAHRLSHSPRTLRRKLRLLGTTYQEILDDIRKERSIHLLKNSNLRLYQISEVVGFKNPAHFRRAFKKWTGGGFSLYR